MEARAAGIRAQQMNNMHQIGIAMLSRTGLSEFSARRNRKGRQAAAQLARGYSPFAG